MLGVMGLKTQGHLVGRVLVHGEFRQLVRTKVGTVHRLDVLMEMTPGNLTENKGLNHLKGMVLGIVLIQIQQIILIRMSLRTIHTGT